jgi:hypothetical protein
MTDLCEQTAATRAAFFAIDTQARRKYGPITKGREGRWPLYEAFPGWRSALDRYQACLTREERAYTIRAVCRPCGCVVGRPRYGVKLLPGQWEDRLTPEAFADAGRGCGECLR